MSTAIKINAQHLTEIPRKAGYFTDLAQIFTLGALIEAQRNEASFTPVTDAEGLKFATEVCSEIIDDLSNLIRITSKLKLFADQDSLNGEDRNTLDSLATGFSEVIIQLNTAKDDFHFYRNQGRVEQ